MWVEGKLATAKISSELEYIILGKLEILAGQPRASPSQSCESTSHRQATGFGPQLPSAGEVLGNVVYPFSLWLESGENTPINSPAGLPRQEARKQELSVNPLE